MSPTSALTKGTRIPAGLVSEVNTSCGLTVQLKALSPQRAGLSYIGAAAAALNAPASPARSPAFVREFEHAVTTGGTDSSGSPYVREDGCLSGCVDVLVRVTNHSGKPVAGARIYASVQPMKGGLARATGFLCGQEIGSYKATTATVCGPTGFHDVDGLATNAAGETLLRYWLPGITSAQTVDLTAKATAPAGCGSSCGSGGESTPATVTLQVRPQRLLETQGTLTRQDVEAIAAWANPTTLRDLIAHGPTADAQALVENALDQKGAPSTLVQDIPVLKWAEVVRESIASASAATKLQTDLLLMLFRPLGLQGSGLYDSSSSTSPPTKPLSSDLLDLFTSASRLNRVQGWENYLPLPLTVSAFGIESTTVTVGGKTMELSQLDPDKYGGQAVTLHDVGAGLLWDFGKYARATNSEDGAWDVRLEVDDVSYCDEKSEKANPATGCGPGYANTNATRISGIEPYIYLNLLYTPATASGTSSGVPPLSERVVIPYNALAWMAAQFGEASK